MMLRNAVRYELRAIESSSKWNACWWARSAAYRTLHIDAGDMSGRVVTRQVA